MKYFIISLIAIMTLSVSAFAQEKSMSAYGELWAGATEKSLDFRQAVLGIQAGLGGTASVDVGADLLGASIYTAKLSYGSLIADGDSLAVGLQSSAHESVLDAGFGRTALNCFSCSNVKAAIYSIKGASLQVAEGEVYTGSYARALAPEITLAGAVSYDKPADTITTKAAAIVKVGVLTAVADGTLVDQKLSYGLTGKVKVYKALGAYGKYTKGGALAIGPTVDPTSQLNLAVVASRPEASADFAYEARISANF